MSHVRCELCGVIMDDDATTIREHLKKRHLFQYEEQIEIHMKTSMKNINILGSSN